MKNRKSNNLILSSSIFVNLASLLVSFVSFLNQIVLASIFGASTSMDAYIVAISTPMMISGLITVTLGFSLVPILVQHNSHSKVDRGFNSCLFISICLIAIVISIIGYFASPLQILILGNDSIKNLNDNTIKIAQISWITAGAMIIVGYLKGMHNSENKFLLGTILGITPFVFAIIFAIIFHSNYGILSVAWGTLFGFILTMPILIFKLDNKITISFNSIYVWKKVFDYLKNIPLSMIALLCFTVLQSIDAYWASNYEEGGLTFLNYSQKLLVSIGGLIVTGPSTVIASRLSNSYRDGRIRDLLIENLYVVRFLVIFSIPVAIFMGILPNEIIYVLFERGKFNEYATNGVARIIPIMFIGMIAMLPVTILFRALFAKNLIKKASILGVAITSLYFTTSGILSYKLGYEGVAIAYTITWWIALAISIMVLYIKESDIILNRENYHFIINIFILSIITLGISIIAKELILKEHTNKIETIFHIIEILMIIMIFYFIAVFNIIKSKEMILIKNYFLRKI